MALGGAWRPWAALAAACAGAGGVVAAVHWQQREERRALRQGVLRDMERLDMESRRTWKEMESRRQGDGRE